MQTLTDRPAERHPAAPATATVASSPRRAERGGAREGDPVLRGGAGILVLRGVAMVPALAVTVGLARLLGVAGFGAYQTVLAWLAVLGVPAGLGVEKLFVQRIAAARARGDWGAIRGLLRLGLSAVGATAVAVGAVVVTLGDRWPGLREVEGLWLVAATLPLMVGLRAVQATLQGFEQVVVALVPELLIVPVAILGALGIAWSESGSLTVEGALFGCFVAHGIALACAVWLLLRRVPWGRLRVEPARYEAGRWLRAGFAFAAIGGLQVLDARLDVLLLASLDGASPVGAFAAANRISALIGLLLLSANGSLAPAIARHHEAGEHERLQAAMTRVVRWVAVLGGLGAIGMIVLAAPLLSVFGGGFSSADDVLVVLAIARFFAVALAAPGLVLMMTGHGRQCAAGLAVGVMLNGVLDLVLIPPYGAMGAAIGTAAGTLCWTGGLALVVRRRLGYDTTVLGLPYRAREGA